MSGVADLAVVTGSLVGGLRRPSLEMITLCPRPAGVLVPVRHPLTRLPRLTLADLIRYPLIVPLPEFLWRQRCEDVFRVAGLFDGLQISVEVSLIPAIEELVRRKVGVGLTPLPMNWQPGQGVVKLPAGQLLPSEHLFLIRRRGKPRPQAQLLEALLLQEISADQAGRRDERPSSRSRRQRPRCVLDRSHRCQIHLGRLLAVCFAGLRRDIHVRRDLRSTMRVRVGLSRDREVPLPFHFGALVPWRRPSCRPHPRLARSDGSRKPSWFASRRSNMAGRPVNSSRLTRPSPSLSMALRRSSIGRSAPFPFAGVRASGLGCGLSALSQGISSRLRNPS